ncbi:MAG: adenylate/guanylate cyclase domain-containing protein [Anaerolineales bacterium]
MPAHVPHILVVDDDWMNREVIEAHLQTRDYRVTTTHNGTTALKLAAEDPPDLIMLDILLPDMSGYEVCARFKANETTRFVPVVMVTALESDDDRLKAIQAGADDFVTKPFNTLLMLTRVRSLLRLKRLNDELQQRTELLQQVLNRYVDKDLAEVILLDPDRYLKLGGETRRVTIVFADISGFTTFAEQNSAQEVVRVLNALFSPLTALVYQHHGTFDKYVGDEIMAFFGAPVATGDDTLNAVMMAYKMRDAFREACAQLGDQVAQLTLEIGLHTGDAVVGNVGSEQKMNYTVIGDAVNTAHRLQEIAHGGQIILSEATYAEVASMVEVRQLPPQTLPGKRNPMTLYELTSVRNVGDSPGEFLP